MNKDQEAHFKALMALIEPLARPKYTAGAIEHNGVLGDLTDEQLFVAETEEIIDLLHYRLSRLLKRQISSDSIGTVTAPLVGPTPPAGSHTSV